MIPVQFVDTTNTDRTLGWVAMPAVPSVDEGVTLPALPHGVVTSVRWEQIVVPHGAVTMAEAGFAGTLQWVAIVALEVRPDD